MCILMQIPWQCGDSDCTADGQWHRASYWSTEDGYSLDEFTDGDHEDIAADQIPNGEEFDRAWETYARWVLSHGRDPLGEYFVRRTIAEEQTWYFGVTNTIAGLMLVSARHRRKKYQPGELPDRIREYLNLARSPVGAWLLQGFANTDDLRDRLAGDHNNVYRASRNRRDPFHLTCRITVNAPRSAAAIRSDLCRRARDSIRTIAKRRKE